MDMPTETKIDVVKVSQLMVYGRDLRRVRVSNNISRAKVCKGMMDLGYKYYPLKLIRMERKVRIYLDPSELMDLLSCMATRIVIK